MALKPILNTQILDYVYTFMSEYLKPFRVSHPAIFQTLQLQEIPDVGQLALIYRIRFDLDEQKRHQLLELKILEEHMVSFDGAVWKKPPYVTVASWLARCIIEVIKANANSAPGKAGPGSTTQWVFMFNKDNEPTSSSARIYSAEEIIAKKISL